MKYFVSAVSESGAEMLHKEIECDTFEDAFEDLRELARLRWPGTLWRPTCVVERPDRTPIDLMLAITEEDGARLRNAGMNLGEGM